MIDERSLCGEAPALKPDDFHPYHEHGPANFRFALMNICSQPVK
jgi:hypothetical protein